MHAVYTHYFAIFFLFRRLIQETMKAVLKCQEYKPNKNKWVTSLCIAEQCVLERDEALALESWSWCSENSRNLCAKIRKLQVAFCHLLFTPDQNWIFQGIMALRATHEAQMCLEMFLG